MKTPTRNPGREFALLAAQAALAVARKSKSAQQTRVAVSLPPRGGEDWNDVLRERGKRRTKLLLEEQAVPVEQPDAIDGALVGTDLQHAGLFVAQHKEGLRYVPGIGWLHWDGRRWKRNAEGSARELAKKTATGVFGRVPSVDRHHQPELYRSARRIQSEAGISAMLGLAKSDEDIEMENSQFDRDRNLLNCLNGTLNLETLALGPHQQSDYITRLAPVEYQPEAKCPGFKRFLKRIIPDKETRDFLQRFLGYCLTGHTREQALIILWGSGSNGKTTLTEVVYELLGDYGITTSIDTLTDRTNRGGGASEHVARLNGPRLILASEGARGLQFNEAAVKDLTGGDTVTARQLYKGSFDFRLQGKFVIRTNHEPVVKGTDEGIWRRLFLVPFLESIAAAERDVHLAEKLRSEWPGILAWLVRGCQRWQRNNLNPPENVRRATQKYRNRMDILGQFIAECTAKETGTSLAAGELYRAYKQWCVENSYQAEAQNLIGTLLKQRGQTTRRVGNRMYYKNLKLLTR